MNKQLVILKTVQNQQIKSMTKLKNILMLNKFFEEDRSDSKDIDK